MGLTADAGVTPMDLAHPRRLDHPAPLLSIKHCPDYRDRRRAQRVSGARRSRQITQLQRLPARDRRGHQNANTNSTGGFLPKDTKKSSSATWAAWPPSTTCNKQSSAGNGRRRSQPRANRRQRACPSCWARSPRCGWGPLTKARRCGGERATRGHLEHSETTPCRYRLPDHQAIEREIADLNAARRHGAVPRSFARVRSSNGHHECGRRPA